jgi:S1-C subfamily serine protease
VNALDLIIAGLVLAAVVRGVLSGVAVQVGSYLGLGVGLLTGALLAPHIAGLADGATTRTLLTLLTVFGLGFALGAAGSKLGTRASALLARAHLGGIDAVLGGVVAGGSALLAVWLLASSFAATGTGGLGGAIQRSFIIRRLDAVMPPVPDLAARLGRLADPFGFPRVFAGLEPSTGSHVTPPADASVQAAAAAAAPSTVKIEGRGCGGVLDGSGFVAAPDLVVTNAHVVAGVRSPTVIDGRGRHAATVVVFDPDLDIAVMRATVSAAPLALNTAIAPRGTGGAVLGYPGGGPFAVGAAAVLTEYSAIGRDIYDRGLVTRQVYQLQAEVQPGSSGGPFVLADGSVAGVVFARSISNGDVGYALAAGAVRERVDRAQATNQTVLTGACAAG